MSRRKIVLCELANSRSTLRNPVLETSIIAQKIGEEGVEVALAAVTGAQDESGDTVDSLLDESADLVYHLLVLLHARGYSLAQLTDTLAGRHAAAVPVV